MAFHNGTALDGSRLRDMFLEAVHPWPTDELNVRVRYSRGSDFSGTCYYSTNRLYVNLGRHLRYPYRLGTHLARAIDANGAWWRPLYTVELSDGYQLALFIVLHEYYHWLVKRARRNSRQKESMCDRFAARVLVDRYGAVVRDPRGRRVERMAWDFQDLERFVARALLPGPRALRSPPVLRKSQI